ncbi:Rrf2 family transcriptional regulator [Bacillus sp. NPDC093026]|uniref:Rrf2 family transcriptional regulator n=1 Tax=Bacillus sp. NPDC093026 TaxID=3363948 RepID=UPI003823E0B2
MLKRAGLLEIRGRVGGAYFMRPAEDITLLDVYQAVDVIENDQLLHFHNRVIVCSIGQVMNTRIRHELQEA